MPRRFILAKERSKQTNNLTVVDKQPFLSPEREYQLFFHSFIQNFILKRYQNQQIVVFLLICLKTKDKVHKRLHKLIPMYYKQFINL